MNVNEENKNRRNREMLEECRRIRETQEGKPLSTTELIGLVARASTGIPFEIDLPEPVVVKT